MNRDESETFHLRLGMMIGYKSARNIICDPKSFSDIDDISHLVLDSWKDEYDPEYFDFLLNTLENDVEDYEDD